MQIYNELTKRNIRILSEHEQETLRNTSILVAGCGVGSVIAELACRTGIGKIYLADGDSVDINNLNRQMFTFEDVGKNKTKATKARIESINPHIEVIAIDEYLDQSNMDKLVADVDFVIDSIDISALDIIFKLHRSATRHGKAVLFPINIGWSSGLFVFTEQSITFRELLYSCEKNAKHHIDGTTILEKDILPMWISLIREYVNNPYHNELMMSFIEDVEVHGWCPVPQIGVASFLTAALVITVIVSLSRGDTVKIAPDIITLDALAGVRDSR